MSRHTFATMELTMGADLYTTSQLLGHADVETTQVYAKIIDAKKRSRCITNRFSILIFIVKQKYIANFACRNYLCISHSRKKFFVIQFCLTTTILFLFLNYTVCIV